LYALQIVAVQLWFSRDVKRHCVTRADKSNNVEFTADVCDMLRIVS